MINTGKKVLIVGVKGVAMAHIAVILKKMGYDVEGADVDETFITDELLAQHGIKAYTRFDIEVMPDAVSHVIYSAAHGGTGNPIVQKARNKGVQVLHQSEFLGTLLKEFTNVVAVCGTHGKTTTTSLLTHALINLKMKPSYMIGAPTFGTLNGSDYNGKDYFIIEADEYGVNPPADKTPKFHHLKPDRILCTNVDYDHPDVYRNLDETKEAFAAFFKGRDIVACFDDEPLMDTIKSSKHSSCVTYGFSNGADARIVNYRGDAKGYVFDLRYGDTVVHEVRTGLSGPKNALNTAGALVMLLEMGFDAVPAAAALRGFGGAKRRLEVLYESGGYTIIDDYAHHPHEIEATIAAVRERYPGAPVRAVFQPHTYSRTEKLLPEFASALRLPDAAYIAPIFASARETSGGSQISAHDIADAVRALGHTHAHAFDTKESMIRRLEADIMPGEVLLVMGAGDIYKIVPELISAIK